MGPVVTGTVSLPEYVAALAAVALGYGAHRLAHRAAAVLTTNRRLVALAPLSVAAPAVALLAVALTYPFIELGSLVVLLAWLAGTTPTWGDWQTAIPTLRRQWVRTESGSDGLRPAITYALLGYTLVLAAILRLFRLGAEAYYVDETITLTFVRRFSAVELLWIIPFRQPHVPLYYVLIDGWTTAFGTAEVVTRLPSVLFSVAMVGALFVLGRRLYTDRVGLLAAFLAAVSPFQVIYAQWTRMYALLGLLAVVGALTAYAAVEGDRDHRLGYYLLASAALSATHVYGMFLVLAHWVFFGTRYRAVGTDARRTIRRAVLGSGLLASPWLFALGVKTVAPGWYSDRATGLYVSSIDAAFPFFPSDAHHLAPALQWLYGGYQSGAVLWLFTGIVAVTVLWAVAGRRRPSPAGWLLIAWFAVPLAVALAISTAHPIFKFKHAMVVAPALYLGMAVGLARRRRLVLGGVLAVLVVTSGLALTDAYTGDRYRPYDDAVAAIADDPATVVATGGPSGVSAFYLERAGVEYHLFTHANASRLTAATEGDCAVWLLYDVPGDRLGEHLNRTLAAEYAVHSARTFDRTKQGIQAGARLVRFEKPGCEPAGP